MVSVSVLTTKYGTTHTAAINNHLRKSLSNPSVDRRGRYQQGVGNLAYLNCPQTSWNLYCLCIINPF